MAMLCLELSDDRSANLIFPSAEKAMRFRGLFAERRSFNGWNAGYLICDLFYYGIEWLPFERYHKAISNQYWSAAKTTLGIDESCRWFDADKESKDKRHELLQRISLSMSEEFNNLYFAEAQYISPTSIYSALPDDMDYDAYLFYMWINLFQGDMFDPASCREANKRSIDYCLEKHLILSPGQIDWERKAAFLSHVDISNLLKAFGEIPGRKRADNLSKLRDLGRIDPDKQRTILQGVGEVPYFQFLPPAPFTLSEFIDAKSIAWAMAWTLKCFESGDFEHMDPVANSILTGHLKAVDTLTQRREDVLPADRNSFFFFNFGGQKDEEQGSQLPEELEPAANERSETSASKKPVIPKRLCRKILRAQEKVIGLRERICSYRESILSARQWLKEYEDSPMAFAKRHYGGMPVDSYPVQTNIGRTRDSLQRYFLELKQCIENHRIAERELEVVSGEVQEELMRMRPNTPGRVPWPDDIPSYIESMRAITARARDEQRRSDQEYQLQRERERDEEREQDRLDKLERTRQEEAFQSIAGLNSQQ